MRTSARVLAWAVIAAASWMPDAYAQTFPVRPVRFIIPFATGGGTDTTARLLAQRLSERWGQSVVVDNRPGAGTVLGTELASHAAADGYTMLMVSSTYVINPSLYDQLPYRLEDFQAVTLIGGLTGILVVHPSLAVASVKDLIALAKASPGKLNYASAGYASLPHIAGALFGHMAKIDIVHVPYRGGAPAVSAILGGQVSMYFSTLPAAIPLVRADKLRALAVTSSKRIAALPAVPTMAEAALPGYEAVTWFGVLTRAGTPHAILRKLNADMVSIIHDESSKAKLNAAGLDDIVGDSPEHFAAFLQREVPRWHRLARDMNLKGQRGP